MNVLSNEELDAIDRRIEAATPGPWEWMAVDGEGNPEAPNILKGWTQSWLGSSVSLPGGWVITHENEHCCQYVDDAKALMDDADADLIAHAPTDLALLVAEVRRYRDALEHIANNADDLAARWEGGEANVLLTDTGVAEVTVNEAWAALASGARAVLSDSP